MVGTALDRASREFTTEMWDDMNPRQKSFVAEYLVDLNATRAAKAAGYAKPNVEGTRLVQRLQGAIDYAIAQRSIRTNITADQVLQRWWDLATADPNELISYTVECCRHCHGIDFRYQWNEEEFRLAEEEWTDARDEWEREHPGRPYPKKELDCRGGFGFDPRRDPNPDCPKCLGRGESRLDVKDTRRLSRRAKALYAGVKMTKEGLEVKMHDQAKALENVARHLGMFSQDAPYALIQNNVQNNVDGSKTVTKITRRIIDPTEIDHEE